MTTVETRRYEMLLHVREFGTHHQDQFPTTTPGGRAFEALAAVVTRLGAMAVWARDRRVDLSRTGRRAKRVPAGASEPLTATLLAPVATGPASEKAAELREVA
jgi:hypothetical protein